jgi:glycosyltransferase involved in cell wall biosynthesis
MSHYYGTSGSEAAEAVLNSGWPDLGSAERYPLTELATQGALGVVTHTRWGFDALSQRLGSKIRLMDLAYPARNPDRANRSNSIPLRLIAFGHFGPNRCLDQVFLALSGWELRGKIQLDIYGEIWDPAWAKSEIARLGLSAHVRLYGYVDDHALDQALEHSDLAINLRNPSMGEASLSQLRIWANSLPALVTRLGWYGDLDPTTVIHVDPEHAIEEIRHWLVVFLENPQELKKIGRNGRDYLIKRHSPAAYAKEIVEFAQEVIDL